MLYLIDKCQPVGRMSINSIANLNKVSKIFSSKLTQTHTSASDENFFSDNSDNEGFFFVFINRQ